MEEKKNRVCLVVLITVGLTLFVVPYMATGIMNNDELLGRYWSFQGFVAFYKHYYNELLYEKGRAMSCFTIPVLLFFEYIGKCSFSMKIIQMIVVFSNVALFGILIKYLFHDKHLSRIVMVLLLVFLPISFEPTLPNAYTTAYGISLSLIYGSLICYILYLRKQNTKMVFTSMLLLFIACCSYEAFITYVPVYLLICAVERKINSWKTFCKNEKALIAPVGTGCLFIIFYVIMGKIYPSLYAGTQMKFEFASTIVILKELFLKSLPGGLLLSDKYRFLFNYYKDNLSLSAIIRISCVLIIVAVCIFLISSDIQTQSKKISKWTNEIGLFFVILMCSVLPSLPISVSEMYQNNVGDQGFVALPVTYFSYFFTTLAVGYITCSITIRIKNKLVTMVFILIVLMIGGLVQTQNEVFSNEMNKDYKRLVNIEDLFKTSTIKELENATLDSEDIFETRNALAIHDSYWSDIAEVCGIDIEVIKCDGSNESTSMYVIYETKDDVFSFVNKETQEVLIFSKTKFTKPEAIKVGYNEYILMQEIDNPEYDAKYWVYYARTTDTA